MCNCATKCESIREFMQVISHLLADGVLCAPSRLRCHRQIPNKRTHQDSTTRPSCSHPGFQSTAASAEGSPQELCRRRAIELPCTCGDMRLHEKRVSSFSLSGAVLRPITRNLVVERECPLKHHGLCVRFHLRVWQQGFSLSSPFLSILRPGSAYNEPFWLEMVRSYRRRVQAGRGSYRKLRLSAIWRAVARSQPHCGVQGSERQLSRRIQPVMQQPCALFRIVGLQGCSSERCSAEAASYNTRSGKLSWLNQSPGLCLAFTRNRGLRVQMQRRLRVCWRSTGR